MEDWFVQLGGQWSLEGDLSTGIIECAVLSSPTVSQLEHTSLTSLSM